MKKLVSLGLTALMLFVALTGFVKAQHTFTFNPPSGSTVAAGDEIQVTCVPEAGYEVVFCWFSSMEEAQAATPDWLWDPYEEPLTVTAGKPVLVVAANDGSFSSPEFNSLSYAEYTVSGSSAAPTLVFPDLTGDKYGRYVPFHAMLTYGGEDLENFEVYYALYGKTPSKSAYDPDDDEILRAIAVDGSAEIMLTSAMAPAFKAVAYSTVAGEEIASNMVELSLTAFEVENPSFETAPGAVPANTVIKIKDNTLTGVEDEIGATILYSKDGETLPLMSAYYDDDDPNVFRYTDADGIAITEDVTIWAIAYKSIGGGEFSIGQPAGSGMLRGRFTVAKPAVNVSLSTEEWTLGSEAPTITVTVPEGTTLGTAEGNVAVKLHIYGDNPEAAWEQIITASPAALDMSKANEAGHEDYWTIECSLVKGDDPTEAFEGEVEVSPEMLGLMIVKDGEKPAAPIFSVPSGEVEKGTQVAITCATAGATLYYTYGDEVVTTPYTGPITISSSCAISAMAEKDGIQSDITKAVYTVKAASVPGVEFTLTPSPNKEIVAGTEIDIEVSETMGWSDIIGYKLYPTLDSAQKDDAGFNMYYEMYPNDGKPVPTVENPVLRVGFYKESTRAWSYGYFTYMIMKDIPMPLIMPEGGEVEKGTEVEISLAEGAEGAKLYYTLDGSEPSEESSEYTQKLIINEDVTVKAIAIKAAGGKTLVSNVAVAAYTVKAIPVVPDTVKTPTFSVAAGQVEKDTKVALACATEDAKIYYTVDGSEPTAESTEYSAEITIDKDMTVKAIAVKEGMENSKVAVAAYTVKVANEANELANVSVYPNPSDGEFNVSVPVNATVEVFAANGQLMQRLNVSAGVNAMRIEKSGIWFVRVIANGQVAVKRVVIR